MAQKTQKMTPSHPISVKSIQHFLYSENTDAYEYRLVIWHRMILLCTKWPLIVLDLYEEA
jgi:hypothetical protein